MKEAFYWQFIVIVFMVFIVFFVIVIVLVTIGILVVFVNVAIVVAVVVFLSVAALKRADCSNVVKFGTFANIKNQSNVLIEMYC